MRITQTSSISCLKGTSAILVGTVLLAACQSSQLQQPQPINIDGSSTVYPITEAIVEQFNAEKVVDVEVSASFSGTGGGFKKFCPGETDINNASRPILKSEMEQCKQNNISNFERTVALDGLLRSQLLNSNPYSRQPLMKC